MTNKVIACETYKSPNSTGLMKVKMCFTNAVLQNPLKIQINEEFVKTT